MKWGTVWYWLLLKRRGCIGSVMELMSTNSYNPDAAGLWYLYIMLTSIADGVVQTSNPAITRDVSTGTQHILGAPEGHLILCRFNKAVTGCIMIFPGICVKSVDEGEWKSPISVTAAVANFFPEVRRRLMGNNIWTYLFPFLFCFFRWLSRIVK